VAFLEQIAPQLRGIVQDVLRSPELKEMRDAKAQSAFDSLVEQKKRRLIRA